MKMFSETGNKALLALAVATLTGVAAGAGRPAGLSGLAKDPRYSNSGKGGVITPGGIAGTNPCVHQWDDGTSTNSLGYPAATTVITWGNRFISNLGCDEIAAVQVAYGTIPANTSVQLYVLSDPNQDGIPDDSVVLRTVTGVTGNENTDTFNTYVLTTPVTVSGSFFVAARITAPANNFPMRYDGTAVQNQSWVTSGSTDANNPFGSAPPANLSNNVDIGFPGNWMIRATGTGNACALPLKACAADIAPAGGNGVVNVDDLLAVINSWGANGNPAGPRPLGDVAPLPAGNCLVNVDDLLAVINGWGTCPTPPAPANDLCANAATVGNGTTLWNNTSANTDGPAGGSCEVNMTHDIWFKYTATCLGSLRINTEGSYPNDDTILAVYSGAGCPGTLVACSDDDGSALLSALVIETQPGQVFKIRVGSYQTSGPVGGGQLNVSCTPHNSDICTDAQPIAIGGSISDDVGGTTPENNLPGCATIAGAGRWYSVVGDGNTLTASTCSSSGAGGLWDPILSVYCSNLPNPCDNLHCVVAANNNTCGPVANPFQETVNFCTSLNQVYYILVGADPSNPPTVGNGLFTLTVNTNGTGCTADPTQCGPLPPPNDECSGAITVVAGANPLFDNTLATTSSGIPTTACTALQKDVWFKYTPTSNSPVEFTLCSTVLTAVDSMMSLLSGTCGNLTELACDDDFCGGANFSRVIGNGLQNGVPVYVRIGGFNGAIGTMQLTINVLPSVCGNGIVEVGEQCDGTPHCTNCVLDNLATIPDAQCTLENEACIVDGGCDVTNCGNDLQTCPTSVCAFSPNVIVGNIYRGHSSTWNTGGVDRRDSDHWTFIPPHAAGTFKQYRLVINADFAGGANFQTAAASVCGGGVAFIEGTAAWTVNTNYQVPVFAAGLQGGVTYSIRVRPSVFTGMPCANGPYTYTFVVIGPVN